MTYLISSCMNGKVKISALTITFPRLENSRKQSQSFDLQKNCLTLTCKVSCGSEIIVVTCFEIANLANVENNTEIKFVASVQPKWGEGQTPDVYDLEFQGQLLKTQFILTFLICFASIKLKSTRIHVCMMFTTRYA